VFSGAIFFRGVCSSGVLVSTGRRISYKEYHSIMVAVLSYDKYVGTCLSSRNCNSLSVAVSCCKLSVYVSGVKIKCFNLHENNYCNGYNK
jgi:thiaminase